MLSKIEFKDDRGWRIAFSQSGGRWSYAVHFRNLLVQPAAPFEAAPDAEDALRLIHAAERMIRDELPEQFIACSMQPHGPRWAMVSLAGLPAFAVRISKAEEAIGSDPEITIGEALELIREGCSNSPIPHSPIPIEVEEWYVFTLLHAADRAAKYDAMIAKLQGGAR